MRSFMFTLLLLNCVASYTLGQNEKDKGEHYRKLEDKYQQLKDSLIYNSFTPAVSSVMLKKGQTEINLFNTVMSANRYRDDNADLSDISFRDTYLYNTLQVNYGVSVNERLNFGLSIGSATRRIDQDRNSSMFKIFNSSARGNSQYASAITAITPRIRWRPLKRNYNFTMLGGISIPTSVSTKKQNILGQGQVNLMTQFLYNQPLNERLFLFSQLSLQYGFRRANTPAVFYSPLSAYFSYFLPRKTIVFALLNYIPILTNENNRYTFQGGGGIQYQISRIVLINGYYTNDLVGRNYGDFNSYSLSLRCLID